MRSPSLGRTAEENVCCQVVNMAIDLFSLGVVAVAAVAERTSIVDGGRTPFGTDTGQQKTQCNVCRTGWRETGQNGSESGEEG